MENLRDALEYVVDLKDNEEKIVRSYEDKEYFDSHTERSMKLISRKVSSYLESTMLLDAPCLRLTEEFGERLPKQVLPSICIIT